MKKKNLVLFLVLLCAILISGCAPKQAADAKPTGDTKPAETKKDEKTTEPKKDKKEEVVLRMYNFGDYIDQDLLKEFTKQTGIKVIYEEYATNEDLYVKMKNSSTQYDVVCPSDYMIMRMIREGMLEKLDMTKIPNFKHINKEYTNLEYDPNNQYSVPYFAGFLGILYNTKIVTDPVDSWSLVFDKKYSGKILMTDAQRDAMAVALRYKGYSINTKNPAEIEEAKKLLLEQKDVVMAYGVDNVKNDMANGSGGMFTVWNGDAIALRRENPDLSFGYAKEGTSMQLDSLAIPKGTKHYEEALMLINFLNDPEINARNTTFVGFMTPNASAVELLAPELRNDPIAYPDSTKFEWEIYKDLGDAIELYNKAWTEIKAN